MGKAKQKSVKQKPSKRVDADAFENPVAHSTFEDENADAEANSAATFEDDSRPAYLARADVVAEGGASISSDIEQAGKGGCCSWLLASTMGTKGATSGAPSIVQFDYMQLMGDGTMDPELHNYAGKLVSFAQPKGLKVSKKDLALSAGGDDADEEESLVDQLEGTLAGLQKQIQKRQQWDDGRAVSHERKEETRQLVLQVKQAEARMAKEKARLAVLHDATLAAADEAAELAADQRQKSNIAEHSAEPNVFTISGDGPVGIDWNYQDGWPVVAGIRNGGRAKSVDRLRIGMVLKQFQQARLCEKTGVGYDRLRREAQKRMVRSDVAIAPGDVVEYLQVCLEEVERPLQLIFETPGKTHIV